MCVCVWFLLKIDVSLSTCQAASDAAHTERERGGREQRREEEWEKEQMPQIEMPINNASPSALTIEGKMRRKAGSLMKKYELFWNLKEKNVGSGKDTKYVIVGKVEKGMQESNVDECWS
ncbi:hypothetical protein ILYODFUR_013956 [Ilyodon furcidens]|uniref:Uncharacterized protein n=1 Tax=Ilyodon furcidens TaxID=33524 RepID=A0ABV0SL35_9TELE